MFEQIKQVGVTYVTHRRLWWIGGLFSLMLLPNLFLFARPNRSAADAAPVLFILGMPMLFLLPFLVGQAKSQFANPRARLMPDFLPAHLMLLGLILVTLFMLYPYALSFVSRSEPLGLVALAAAIGVPALWGAQLNRFVPMLVALAVFYSLLTKWGFDWWVIDASSHRAVHAVLVGVGAVLLAAWLWRLCHLQEESDDYLNPYQLIMARRTGSEAVEQRRIVAAQVERNRLAGRVGDWWHERLGGYHGGSKAAIARVLRYGFAAAPVEFQGLFMVAMVVCLGIFFSQFSILAKSGSNFGAYFFFAQFAILLPGQIAGQMMVQRRPRIAYEMLLPLSRAQLINGLFTASARNSITLWLMMNAAMGVVVATTNDQILPRTVAMYVLMSASTMFAAMGLSLRTSVWPSMAKRFTVLWLSWVVLLAPMIVWGTLREKVGDAPFNVVAAVLIGVGAWLLYAARKAWLDLEFV